MKLTKLFETQKLLDYRIEREHPTQYYENRKEKRVLALLVEIGELANEQRSWKFWSNDQTPRTHNVRTTSDGYRMMVVPYNPLLEEYVDCLHFILSLGYEVIEWTDDSLNLENHQSNIEVEKLFLELYMYVSDFLNNSGLEEYLDMKGSFELLGNRLGFTTVEVIHAYLEKNRINHMRQDGGY